MSASLLDIDMIAVPALARAVQFVVTTKTGKKTTTA